MRDAAAGAGDDGTEVPPDMLRTRLAERGAAWRTSRARGRIRRTGSDGKRLPGPMDGGDGPGPARYRLVAADIPVHVVTGSNPDAPPSGERPETLG